jgi:hypothetical protein
MVRRLFYAPTAHETSRRCDPASDAEAILVAYDDIMEHDGQDVRLRS